MNFEFDPLGLPCELHGPHGSRVTQNGHFLLSKHTKHLLLVTFCDRTAKIGVSPRDEYFAKMMQLFHDLL